MPRCFDFICQFSEGDPTAAAASANGVSSSIVASALAILTNVLCDHGDEESVRHIFRASTEDANEATTSSYLKRLCLAIVGLVAQEGPQMRWLRSASRRILYLLAASPTGRLAIVEETQALIVLKMHSPKLDDPVRFCLVLGAWLAGSCTSRVQLHLLWLQQKYYFGATPFTSEFERNVCVSCPFAG